MYKIANNSSIYLGLGTEYDLSCFLCQRHGWNSQ